jgi:tRNA A37 N6-isopentenylltransferase MiaA
VFRFVLGLLVGIILGAGGTAYFFSVAGGGDYLLTSSQRVYKLEQDLQRVSQERDAVTRKLEDMTNRMQEMANKFNDLERRFRALEETTPKTPGTELKESGRSSTPEA